MYVRVCTVARKKGKKKIKDGNDTTRCEVRQTSFGSLALCALDESAAMKYRATRIIALQRES